MCWESWDFLKDDISKERSGMVTLNAMRHCVITMSAIVHVNAACIFKEFVNI